MVESKEEILHGMQQEILRSKKPPTADYCEKTAEASQTQGQGCQVEDNSFDQLDQQEGTNVSLI